MITGTTVKQTRQTTRSFFIGQIKTKEAFIWI